MELEVRVVGGIESCFVSLPLTLIQNLQTTRQGVLPPVIALELRSSDHHIWNVAWSGSASSSSAIEVAQQLAECISLLDHTVVHVRAIGHLPKATGVTIEPNGEDDWEVLELNSEHAEAVILKQVGIVYEGMKFPLWVHGHIVTMFIVVSTYPKNSVVQLVPGTEVFVAPKSRKKNVGPYDDSNIQASEKEQSVAKALLRIQDLKVELSNRCEVDTAGLSVALTSVVFIHPDTAKNSMFDNLQLVVIFPRILSKESLRIKKNDALTKSSSTAKEASLGGSDKKEVSRNLVVLLIYSDLVARGHVMLPQSLRYYLRANLHSWVYAKSCNIPPRKDAPFFTVSPCRFKLSAKDKTPKDTDLSLVESRRSRKTKNSPLNANLIANGGVNDWSIHEEVFSSLCPRPAKDDDQDGGTDQPYIAKGQQSLLQAWLIGQLKTISSNTGVNMSSLVLGNETLLHFEVIGDKFQSHEKKNGASDSSSISRIRTGEAPVELLYLLTANESSHGDQATYEFYLADEDQNIKNLKDSNMFGKLDLGDPLYLDSVFDKTLEKNLSSGISSLSWMGTGTSDVLNRSAVHLSLNTGKWFSSYKLSLPGHALIYGPAGSGKTSLAAAVAKYFEEHEEILAHIVFISCSRLSLEKPSMIRQELKGYLSEALEHSPSLVIFDDLDSIVSSSFESEGSQTSASTTELVEFLTNIIDDHKAKRLSLCGIGPIAFIACVQSLEKFPKSLSSPGRFDFHVQLPAPAVSERGAVLKHEIHKRSLQCSEEILTEIASKCDGYDAYDLEILVDRAVHAAIKRYLSSFSTAEGHENPVLVREDFSEAMTDFLPVAMRDITKSASEGGRTGWDEVGGLVNIRNAIQEMVELPSKFPSIFGQAPLRLRSNVLLYGPPGCGKTHIVGAAAAACSLRFISVKGPELLNKYIGASEQAVRDIFSKAGAAAPCLLFFDEFDSIAPKRGHDNTGVTDRVVNQFLTELDGVEALTGVFVFAATSRPDLLDAALLRPGRFDRLLFCDFPSWQERVDILTVLSRKLPLASDVNLEAIASVTEGFSGADLQALLSDAQLASVHVLLESTDGGSGKMPVIDNMLLRSVASTARPSVSETEKRRLYGIYNQFLDAKKSVAAQSKDAKGKRATLA